MYFLAARNVLVTGLAFLVFTGLTAGMVYLLSRIDRKEATEDPYPKYGTRKKGPFKWEYVPLSTITLLLLFGETMANFALT